MACDKIFCNIFLDILALAFVGIPLLLIQLQAEPSRRGYFENDETIRYPYREQSISEVLLASLGFIVIILTVLVAEIRLSKEGVGNKLLGEKTISGWLWESYRTIGVYTFGALCQQLLVTAGKYTIGRLRPHFYSVCRPVPGTAAINELGYILDYSCTYQSTNEDRIKSARLSFPSGHSCYAMYTAIFFICYLQYRCKWRGSKLFRHVAQLGALIAAWYVGLSRVQEHQHHWGDVAAGFTIGTAVAIFTFVYVLKPKVSVAQSWQEAPPQNGLPRPVLAR